jgi:hypothetical protein
MVERLANTLVSKWILADDEDTPEIEATHNLVSYLSAQLFDDYEPCQFEVFADRLDQWLGSVELDKDRRTLYLALKLLFFVGRREFESLCRAAFHGPITRWLLDNADIGFDDEDVQQKWKAAIEDTWFCPITDSMRINAFFKVNGLDGKQLQPDWRSLREFGDPNKIKQHIRASRIKRIVLLEDFVGTGTQMSNALSFAASLDRSIPVLGCPLIICPEGLRKEGDLARDHKNLSFAHVMSLPDSAFVNLVPQVGENPAFPDLRQLIKDTAGLLSAKPVERTHGFKGTGAMVVLYSNCPDNTLPIIHEKSDKWQPLFPRIRRA